MKIHTCQVSVYDAFKPVYNLMHFFVSTVESELLYGAETWIITKKVVKQIDGCYTRILGIALDVSWEAHLTNEELY